MNSETKKVFTKVAKQVANAVFEYEASDIELLLQQIERQMEDQEKLVNELYKSWLREKDGHPAGFEDYLVNLLPDLRFSFIGHEWKLVQSI
jgi:hypothetical protein